MTARAARWAALILAALPLAGRAAPPLRETAYRDVVFARPNGRPIALDLYVPESRTPPPLVVWFHGGAWKFGDKRFHFCLRHLTRYGIAVATAQYRLTGSATWPAQRDDAIAAVDWLRANGKAYGVDTSRMGISGESSGGHLASLVATLEGKPRLKAVVALYPPTDLTRLAWRYRKGCSFSLVAQLFGGPYEKTGRQMAEASPVNFITHKTPPFFLMHGDRDIVVPVGQSYEMLARLRKAGVEAHLWVLHGQIHGFTLNEGQLRKVAEFFQSHL